MMDLDRCRELLGGVDSWEEIPEEKECKRSGSHRNTVNLINYSDVNGIELYHKIAVVVAEPW